MPGCLCVVGFLVQLRDAIPQIARLFLFRFGLRRLFLSHKGPNLLRYSIALCFQRFDLSEQLSPLLIESNYLIDPGLISSPAGGETLTNKIRLLANQFDVEHRRIIGAWLLCSRL